MTPKTETNLGDFFRNRLQEIEEEELISKEGRKVVTLDQQSVGRLSRMDAVQQQAMAQATQRRRQGERAALISALARIADGSFGVCDDCEGAIDPARLKLNPAARLCMECTVA